MINAGIIGLGFMAATHLKAYRQVANARVAAICNPSGRRLDGDFSDVGGNLPGQEALRLDMTQVKAFRDLDAFLADPEIDLVDICAPTPAHHSLVLAALKAGKHVLCEKPFAHNSQQAREMVAAAAGSDKMLMPAMCLRFWPEWAWLKKAISEQTYGRTLAAHFRRVAPPPAWNQTFFLDGAQSGGALLDLHIHDVDFIQFCFGKPKRVFASGYSVVSNAVDHVMAHYRFDSELMVTAEGGWAMAPGFGFNMSYTVNFERATADYDMSRGAEALKLFESGQETRVINCEGPDGFIAELTHIAEAIQGGHAPSVVTAAEAISAIEICEAEEQSVRTGQVVAMS